MQNFKIHTAFVVFAVAITAAGCGDVATNTTVNTSNLNANSNMALSNSNANTMSQSLVPEAGEPGEYQATVTMRIEAIGEGQQATAFPTLTAQVARSGNDRRMVFTMPAGGRVVFLDKAGTNYMIMPEKKQYAEINAETTGFEVRRILMPEQIVQQVQNLQGVERVGEETFAGRQAVRYRYASVADTQTQAGQVATESFLIVDSETGLPLRSETVSRSQSGGNVQGYQGLRVVTEITEIQTATTPDLFEVPTGLQQIETEQVRSQIDMIFTTVAGVLTQVLNQAQTQTQGTAPAANTNANANMGMTPTPRPAN